MSHSGPILLFPGSVANGIGAPSSVLCEAADGAVLVVLDRRSLSSMF